MRAALYRRFGPARDVLVMEDIAVPAPAAGELRVRVHASAVNPSDVKTRAGQSRPLTADYQVPGSDGAGVIDAVGDGVSPSRIGERVWVFNAAFLRPHGTSAEYCVVPAAWAQPLPDAIDFAEGACLGIPVMTAHLCLFSDGPITGQTVLVTGGAGVVGHYAIQLAKWGGARVVTTVSSEAKAAHALAAGADLVLDYRNDDLAARLQDFTAGHGVQRIVEVDLGANLPVSCSVIAQGGTIASYASMGVPEPALPFYKLAVRNVTLRNVLMYTMPERLRREALTDIPRWIADGRAQFAVAGRFPLAAVVDAHLAVEAGRKIGHVIVDVA
jgi:NADPH:quinone reductase-like Zn-dependent oxidoreductase